MSAQYEKGLITHFMSKKDGSLASKETGAGDFNKEIALKDVPDVEKPPTETEPISKAEVKEEGDLV